MSNDEKRDIEDRINDAMAKIVSDTAGEPQPENKNNRSAAHKSARPSKSARPRKITYVLNLNLSLYPKRKSIRH